MSGKRSRSSIHVRKQKRTTPCTATSSRFHRSRPSRGPDVHAFAFTTTICSSKNETTGCKYQQQQQPTNTVAAAPEAPTNNGNYCSTNSPTSVHDRSCLILPFINKAGARGDGGEDGTLPPGNRLEPSGIHPAITASLP